MITVSSFFDASFYPRPQLFRVTNEHEEMIIIHYTAAVVQLESWYPNRHFRSFGEKRTTTHFIFSLHQTYKFRVSWSLKHLVGDDFQSGRAIADIQHFDTMLHVISFIDRYLPKGHMIRVRRWRGDCVSIIIVILKPSVCSELDWSHECFRCFTQLILEGSTPGEAKTAVRQRALSNILICSGRSLTNCAMLLKMARVS
jgi:hypothetical protein